MPILDSFKVTTLSSPIDSLDACSSNSVNSTNQSATNENITSSAITLQWNIDSSAKIEPYTILNGPIYIGKNVLIKSHSNISNSIIEESCKIKGEVHSSIFQPFSNKAHEGFIGNSFIGSWANLGAGTTTSNLKNNYSNVFVKWDGELVDTDTIFFGSVIGEHVKTSIGTNLNTGTIIEMGCNIVSQSFPPRHIPSFSFYYNGKISKISFEDFKDTATIAMSRRSRDFSTEEDTFIDLYKKD